MSDEDRCKLIAQLAPADQTYIRVLFITLKAQTENDRINHFLTLYRELTNAFSQSESIWIDTARGLRVEELNHVA